MSTALSGLVILVFVIPGYFLAKLIDYHVRHQGRWVKPRKILHQIQEKVLGLSLWVLLFLMGLRLMADPQVAGNLALLGGQALIYTSLAVLFSILAALPLGISSGNPAKSTGILPADSPTIPGESERPEASPADLRLIGSDMTHPARKIAKLLLTPLKLLAIVIAGALVALAFPCTKTLPINLLTDVCLKIMLVAVGLGLGFTPLAKLSDSFRKTTLLLPLVTIIASLAAGALASLWLIPRLGHSMAVTAGFGWYSLSGVLIADLGNPQLGALAFLSNLFRESLALLSIPLLQHWSKSASAIAAAGATSMDVSLPVLTLYGAGPLLPLAVYHGFVLSLAVPVLVPLLMGF